MEFGYLSQLNTLKRRHIAFLLAAIIILGFIIRYVPFLHKLAIDDTYYQYSIAKSILKEGHIPERLPLAHYPTGMPLGGKILLPYFIAQTYRTLQPLGVSLVDYMIIFPPLFGALAAVPLYFLTKQLFDKKTAIFAAFIYVFLPASIFRTYAGFVEKESLAAILIFTWAYFFLRSYKELRFEDRKSLLLPILSGIFMGLSFMTWGGAAYYAFLIALSVFIYILLKPDKILAYSIVMMSLSGFGIMYLLSPSTYNLQWFLFNYHVIPLTFVSAVALVVILPETIERISKKKIKTIHLIILFLFLSFLYLSLFNMEDKVLRTMKTLIDEISGRSTSPLAAEAQKLTDVGVGMTIKLLSLLIFFIPIGVYYLLKKTKGNVRFEQIFLLIWIVTASYASYVQWRLFFNLASIASMFVAYAFFEMLNSLTNNNKKSTLKANVLILIFFLSLLSSVVLAVQFAGEINEANSPRLYYWEDAMAYVQDNTLEGALVVAWWDYGYMIQGLGGRATIVDPGIAGQRRGDVAKILTSSEDEAVKIIKKYNPKDTPVYVMVSVREIFIHRVIRETAQDDDLDIRIILHIPKSPNQKQEASKLLDILSEKRSTIYWLNYPSGDHYDLIYLPNLDNPEIENNLLPQLLPFKEIPRYEVGELRLFGLGERLKHFQLVWDNGYVYIYKVI
jgi:dolichyl-diphosphooligosaccharide--protein glycosyltransferase